MNDPHRQLLAALQDLSAEGRDAVSSRELAATANLSLATVKRTLDRLQGEGRVIRHGNARATRYMLAELAPQAAEASSTA
nr:winged helix-turn-helix transcriptional regulator [Paraburkholderia sp. NMBU_R16]